MPHVMKGFLLGKGLKAKISCQLSLWVIQAKYIRKLISLISWWTCLILLRLLASI
jgi:hypothetical protein